MSNFSQSCDILSMNSSYIPTRPTALQVHAGKSELDLAETNCTSGIKLTRPEEAQPSWQLTSGAT